MQQQVRKHNRLQHFDYSQSGAYFVTICVKDKKCLLSKITTDHVGCDALIAPKVELTKYGFIAKKYLESMDGIESFVIMPNHIHLIIIKNGAMRASHPTRVSDDIRSFKILFTKELGASIWQKSFYDHIIRNEDDFIFHLQYIEENPKKWLLGKDEYYA